MSVNHSARLGGRIAFFFFFSIFFNMKVCYVFSLELHHRGDSNEYKQTYQYQYKIGNHRNYHPNMIMPAAIMEFCPRISRTSSK